MGGGAQRRGHVRLRPVVVLLVVCGVVALTTGTLLAPTARSSGTPDDFVLGSAEAKADTLSAGIVAGGATIGLTWGRTIAKYQESTGLAEGRALDLGILKDLLGSTCDGSPPALDPATIPPAVRVDSRDAGAAGSHITAAASPGAAAPGPPVGTQDARATNQPWSWAGTATVDTNLFLVGLDGGRAEVTTEIVDGTRRAKAVVTGTELSVLGGLISFKDPRWEAEAASGAETTTTGRFTFSSAKLFGVDRSAADAEAGFEQFAGEVEKNLDDLGVHLDYPRVEVEDKRVSVTPMEFGVTDPPAGARYLAPALAKAQPLREVLVDYMLKVDCKNATTVTLLDVVLSILAGSGSLSFKVGGVTVSTDDTVFENPFGAGGAALGTGSASSARSVPAQKAAVAGAGGTGTVPAPASEPEAAIAAPSLDEAANRKFMDGSTGGIAVAVGAVALAGAAALATGDLVAMRRGRRRIPDA